MLIGRTVDWLRVRNRLAAMGSSV